MGTKSQWEKLNESLGYEVAVLTWGNPLTKREIQSCIPFEYVNDGDEDMDTKIGRTVNSLEEHNILYVTRSRGTDEFCLDTSEFCDRELAELNRRAITRMHHPSETKGKRIPVWEIPDEYFVKYDRSDVYFGSEEVMFVHALDRNRTSVYTLGEEDLSIDSETDTETDIVTGEHTDAPRRESMFTGQNRKPWTWD